MNVNSKLQDELGIGKVSFIFTTEEFKLISKKNLFIECCHENDIEKSKYWLNLKVCPVDVNSMSEDKKWSGKIYD